MVALVLEGRLKVGYHIIVPDDSFTAGSVTLLRYVVYSFSILTSCLVLSVLLRPALRCTLSA